MKYIYYCKNCKSTCSAEYSNVNFLCPQCKVKTFATKITDDEWQTKTPEEKESLKEIFEQKIESSSGNANTIGNALKYAGWVYICLSCIGSFIITDEINGTYGFISFLFGCLGGLLLLGFAEVVNLLQDIKNK